MHKKVRFFKKMCFNLVAQAPSVFCYAKSTVSLRLGHARALTPRCGSDHIARVLSKSLPPGGRGTAIAVEGARVNESSLHSFIPSAFFVAQAPSVSHSLASSLSEGAFPKLRLQSTKQLRYLSEGGC